MAWVPLASSLACSLTGSNIPLLLLVDESRRFCLFVISGLSRSISRPNSNDSGSGAFTTGLLLQLTNIKVYLYFITGLGAFSLPGILATIPARWLLMVVVGSLGTFLWTGGGQLINAFYQKHFRLVNSFVALLLVFSAIDLWR
ncbi:hypothetical protein [Lacticaseibacillus manihotivorans]|uniref:hypothetical protein n=1 Tax=Lacticaseibacillus manihotivorans TaxID=88233 RepID=UPI001FB4FCAA|nr:hypothetical protein [Lacticaseibacillus manihotivorans]